MISITPVNFNHSMLFTSKNIEKKTIKSFQQKCAEFGLNHKKTSLKDLACVSLGLDPKITPLSEVEATAGKSIKEIIYNL